MGYFCIDGNIRSPTFLKIGDLTKFGGKFPVATGFILMSNQIKNAIANCSFDYILCIFAVFL
ncbi:hypothetical protein [Calothrix rhizosoleniae]|uniref:hypothetical protein n=1 Tax=Calothrix rhizosoleniae TaxID=888997 RepID=UPI001178958E|nr:hypothetical protein [Calothrix rhizosoleniae]